jgi:hypothetical protein
MKKSLLPLTLLMLLHGAFAGADASAPLAAPVIQAKVSLLEGIFAYDERCNYRIAPTWDNPIQYRMQFVRDGEPLGYDVIFTFAGSSLPDGRVELTVQRQVFNRGKLDRRESRSDVVRLARGREEALKLDTWYGDGFGKMQALFKLELRYDGESRPVTAPRRDDAGRLVPKHMACGQVFL